MQFWVSTRYISKSCSSFSKSKIQRQLHKWALSTSALTEVWQSQRETRLSLIVFPTPYIQCMHRGYFPSHTIHTMETNMSSELQSTVDITSCRVVVSHVTRSSFQLMYLWPWYKNVPNWFTLNSRRTYFKDYRWEHEIIAKRRLKVDWFTELFLCNDYIVMIKKLCRSLVCDPGNLSRVSDSSMRLLLRFQRRKMRSILNRHQTITVCENTQGITSGFLYNEPYYE